PGIFAELRVEDGTKSLVSDFKAFRFPSTARVNFVATVRFCQDACEPSKCAGGTVSMGRRKRAVHKSLLDTDENIDDEDEHEVTIEFTDINDGEVTIPLKSTTYDTTLPRTTMKSTPPFIATSSNAYSNVTSSVAASTSSLAASSSSEAEPSTESELMPNDIPISLALVVGEDTMPEGWDNQYRRREHYVDDHYVCTPTSAVIASVFTLLVILTAVMVGAMFFYRTKRRQWKKLAGGEPFAITQQAKGGFYNSPDVMFRMPYGGPPPGFPGQPSRSSNMAASLQSAHPFPKMHDEAP
ncbi:unnamed protein product, partial [Meganyctiphanes norvegica]